MEPTLPEDVMLEVISRMAPRDAMKCCVSKNWRTLLSSSHFRSLHFDNFTRKESNTFLYRHLFVDPNMLRFEAFSLVINPYRKILLACPSNCSSAFHIAGIVHGLICLLDKNVKSNNTVYLWNPIVKRMIELPPNLITAPKFEWRSLGFAFDDTQMDYKVFDVATNSGYQGTTRTVFIAVYSLRREVWTLLPATSVPRFVLANRSHGAFLEGSCHWPVYGEEPRSGEMKCYALRIRADDHSCSMLDLPDAIRMTIVWHTVVSVLGGCLALISFLWSLMELGDSSRNVWIMKEYGNPSSWIVRYRIRREIVYARGPHEIVLIRNGQILDRTRNEFDPNGQVVEVSVSGEIYYLQPFSQSLELLETGLPRNCFCSL